MTRGKCLAVKCRLRQTLYAILIGLQNIMLELVPER